MKIIVFLAFLVSFTGNSFAQTIHGKIVDAVTKEPISAATIADTTGAAVISGTDGSFTINTTAKTLKIISVGYQTRFSEIEGDRLVVGLQPVTSQLNKLVVSANRTAEKRRAAPIAIATLSKQTLQKHKTPQIERLVNKVSRV